MVVVVVAFVAKGVGVGPRVVAGAVVPTDEVALVAMVADFVAMVDFVVDGVVFVTMVACADGDLCVAFAVVMQLVLPRAPASPPVTWLR